MTTQESKWLNDRIGNFTASNIHKLMVSGKPKGNIFGDGAMTYIVEIVGEMLTGESKPDISKIREIEWGNAHEQEAMAAYIARTGKNVLYFGKGNPVFFPLLDLPAGGSPDGLIENKRVIEIKCPYDTANHVKNSILTLDGFKKERKNYYAQIQLNMIVTNVMTADFCSYDPRMLKDQHKLRILEIPLDMEFCKNMIERIRMAAKLRDGIYNRMMALDKLRKAS